MAAVDSLQRSKSHKTPWLVTPIFYLFTPSYQFSLVLLHLLIGSTSKSKSSSQCRQGSTADLLGVIITSMYTHRPNTEQDYFFTRIYNLVYTISVHKRLK